MSRAGLETRGVGIGKGAVESRALYLSASCPGGGGINLNRQYETKNLQRWQGRRLRRRRRRQKRRGRIGPRSRSGGKVGSSKSEKNQ